MPIPNLTGEAGARAYGGTARYARDCDEFADGPFYSTADPDDDELVLAEIGIVVEREEHGARLRLRPSIL